MKKLFTLFVTIVLTGCVTMPGSQSSNVPLSEGLDEVDLTEQSELLDIDQELQTKKLAIETGEKILTLDVEVARNTAQRKQGLMYRESLAEDKGMLFVFDHDGVYKFWMKNTLIPLDMLFLSENGTIEYIEHGATPCKTETCALYGPQFNVRYVLEIKGGLSEIERIEVGDKVSWV